MVSVPPATPQIEAVRTTAAGCEVWIVTGRVACDPGQSGGAGLETLIENAALIRLFGVGQGENQKRK